MSKASEYAKAMQGALLQAPPNLELCDPDCRETIISAGALSDGRLAVMQAGLSMRLDPTNAIKLARWILDTFGEPDAR